MGLPSYLTLFQVMFEESGCGFVGHESVIAENEGCGKKSVTFSALPWAQCLTRCGQYWRDVGR